MPKRTTCFVIMPFGKTKRHTEEYWTQYFEDVLKPLIEEVPNVDARRSQALRGDIVKEIIKDLLVSPVVVADLTDNNPNVYWELGIRQTSPHGTVTIAESGTPLPFDISTKGTLFYYPKNQTKLMVFRKRVKEAIRDCIVHPDRSDSIVLEAISGRGTLFEIVHRDEMIRRLDGVLSELNTNDRVVAQIAEKSRKNQEAVKEAVKKGRTGRSVRRGLGFPLIRLRLAATELVITNRYVDESPTFYIWAEKYYTWLVAFNEQLLKWSVAPNHIEKWLLGKENRTKQERVFRRFREQVEVAREKLLHMI